MYIFNFYDRNICYQGPSVMLNGPLWLNRVLLYLPYFILSVKEIQTSWISLPAPCVVIHQEGCYLVNTE